MSVGVQGDRKCREGSRSGPQPGIQTSGTVTRLSMAGDFVVKLVDKRFVLVPSRFGVPFLVHLRLE